MIAHNEQVRTVEVAHAGRRSVSRRTVIDEAKAKVLTIDLADRLCGPGQLRRRGAEWVGSCPLPDHEDRVPSFTVNPEKNLFWCHGCLRGGDVVRLARTAWGYPERDDAMAAADLLREFGHGIPPRPASWHRRQSRQEHIRERIDAEKIEHVRMIVFRIVFAPWLKRLPGFIKEEATASAWAESLPIAREIYARRRDS